MLSIVCRSGRQTLCILGALLVAAPALALVPDEIALVVNADVPDSRTLAELYARERHIPDGRIIELHLDPGSVISPAEEMPFDGYEPLVAAPIRDFLTRKNLQSRVKCLVTFWGVPMRIERDILSPEARDEYANVTKELTDTRAAIARDVGNVEQLATQLDPAFKPQKGDELPKLAKRLDASLVSIVRSLPTVKETAARNASYSEVVALIERLLGADRTTQVMAQPAVALFSPHPPTPEDVTGARSRLTEIERALVHSQANNTSAVEREKARTLARDSLGLFGYAFVVLNQEEMLSPDQSESALDSELSLLWWHDYPKARWVPNQLEWRAQLGLRERHLQSLPTLMVTRLDGPSLDIVRNIIRTSVQIEAQGLHGQVAIDARGKTGNDPYAAYDLRLRNLGELLTEKTKLKVTLENTDALIAPHSLPEIAVYCGWYSLRNYSSPGSFSPGAVGFHVASFECVSLRRPREHGWVRGLLSEGVVGTVGPVAEPFLQSFPPADEFFPLLMTGKLTLAEVYWRTLPWTSWMQMCIGDPLYNPYKNNPPLAVDDLPAGLRTAIAAPESGPPTTNPAMQSVQ
jgi:uncharacterized protein (TIGR03790 family)